VNLKACVTATPFGAPESVTNQRPQKVLPMNALLFGMGKLTEPYPTLVGLVESCRLTRANEPVAGMFGPVPGSLSSITSTDCAPARAPEMATVKFGLPARGGSMAMIVGTMPPVPGSPVPVTCGTRVDSE